MDVLIPETVRVLLPSGAVQRMELEPYVAGVVAATLPSDSPLEALKAQAVAARTFAASTRRHIERGADVCTERHCQVWQPRPFARALQAAQETQRLVAVHLGRLIDAYYFEHCDGSTRDAAGILLHAPPYLRGVTCPCGFATLKGHGIGMCQRGAVVMARFGDSFDLILRHYYSGITLVHAGVSSTPPAEVEPPPVPERMTARRRQLVRAARVERAQAEQATAPLAAETAAEPNPEAEVSEPPAGASAALLAPRAAEERGEERAAGPPSEAVEPPPQAPAPIEPVETPTAPFPPRARLSLDEIEEPTWYPLAEELGPEREQAEVLDQALEMEIPFAEPEPAAKEEISTARERAPAAAPSPRTVKPPPPPGSMPEELPFFPLRAPEPIEPPPLVEEAAAEVAAASGPSILVDSLPGPRIIAGDLTRSGVIVTIRDQAGNAVITVSGTAPQHGPGGFEAPLPDPGGYRVSFDHQAVEVELRDETIFITCSA